MANYTKNQVKTINKIEVKIGEALEKLGSKIGVNPEKVCMSTVETDEQTKKLLSLYDKYFEGGKDKITADEYKELLKERTQIVNDRAKEIGGFDVVDLSVYESDIEKITKSVLQKNIDGKVVRVGNEELAVGSVEDVAKGYIKDRFTEYAKGLNLGLTKAQGTKAIVSELKNEDILNNIWKNVKEKFGDKVVTKDTKVNGTESDDLIINGLNITDLIKVLKEKIVTVKFVKANGEPRVLVGTRNSELVNSMLSSMGTDKEDIKGVLEKLDGLNTDASIKLQLGKNTIPVFDLQKGEFRNFNTYRLTEYTIGGETFGKVQSGDANKHFNPQPLSVDEINDVLSKKIVRLVFKKKDGNNRVMFATRDSYIANLYEKRDLENIKVNNTKSDADKEAQKQQDAKNGLIKCFDVTARGWRSFKKETLLRYDDAIDISSWLEFDIEDDGWFNICYNGAVANRFYTEGERVAKKIGSGSEQRAEFEDELSIIHQEYLDKVAKINENINQRNAEYDAEQARKDAVEKMKASTTQFDLRLKVSLGLVKPSHATFTDTSIKFKGDDKEVFNELRQNLVNLDTAIKKAVGLDKGFINIDVKEDLLLILAKYHNGETFIITPRYLMNGSSFKVYEDITKLIQVGQGATFTGSEADAELGTNMDKLASIISKRVQRRNREVKVSFAIKEANKKDIARNENLDVNLTKYKESIKDSKDKDVVQIGQHKLIKKDDEIYVILQGKNDKFKLSPAGIVGEQRGVVYKRIRHTASTMEFVDFVRDVLSQGSTNIEKITGFTPGEFKVISEIMSSSFDLRNGALKK